MGEYNRNRKSKPIRSNYARFGRKDSSRDDFERPRRKSSFRDSDSPGMHSVTCDKCGKSCEVPFRPTGNKPVYCSDCFRRQDSRGDRDSSRGSSYERRDSRRFDRGNRRSRDEERVMTDVVCDKCGKECQVPFKPTPGKPIYCNECFKNNDSDDHSGSKGNSEQIDNLAREIEKINEKLDKIMKSLSLE